MIIDDGVTSPLAFLLASRDLAVSVIDIIWPYLLSSSPDFLIPILCEVS